MRKQAANSFGKVQINLQFCAFQIPGNHILSPFLGNTFLSMSKIKNNMQIRKH